MTDRLREKQAKALQSGEEVNALGDATEEDEVDFGGDTAEQLDDAMDVTETLEQPLHAPTPPTVAGGSSETAGTKHEHTANTQVEIAPPPPPHSRSDSSSAGVGPKIVVPPPPPKIARHYCQADMQKKQVYQRS